MVQTGHCANGLLGVPIGVLQCLLKRIDSQEGVLELGVLPDGRCDAHSDSDPDCERNYDWHGFSFIE